MARVLERQGRPFVLHYFTRGRNQAPLLRSIERGTSITDKATAGNVVEHPLPMTSASTTHADTGLEGFGSWNPARTPRRRPGTRRQGRFQDFKRDVGKTGLRWWSDGWRCRGVRNLETSGSGRDSRTTPSAETKGYCSCLTSGNLKKFRARPPALHLEPQHAAPCRSMRGTGCMLASAIVAHCK